MRAANVVTALVLMLLGGVVISDAVRLGIGWGEEGPRSGFFPFWLAVLLVTVSVLVLVQALLRSTRQPFVTRERLVPVVKVLGPLIGFVVVTDPPGPSTGLGLYVAAGLYLGFYMRWVGGHRWVAVVALSVAVPAVAFVVFEQWFLVPMPKGPVESWLGY
jgi:hypothetical protein